VAGAGDPGDVRWKVFISHTSELREFPRETSYVAAVERAIAAAEHVIVDMRDFSSADQAAADVCAARVRECDVYIGILGTRYGSPVPDKPEQSYTELEFETATGAGLDRLMFLLDTEADNVGIPSSRLIDREYGGRQDDFRRRVREGQLVSQSFASPAELQLLVERSLRELAQTRARVVRGLRREQVPAQPPPVRASKFVNPPPATAPDWFQNRQVQTGLLAEYVTDPAIRLVIVTGRGGVGKTAMVCRFLKSLEAGRVPDVEGEASAITVGGVVYLGQAGVHKPEYSTLVADMLRLLPEEEAHRLRRVYQDAHRSSAEMMLALLEAFPAGEPVLVLLDNLESVMDTESETLTEPALHEALSAVLTAPAHAVTVIATTRVIPTGLLMMEPARQRRLPLDKGLGAPDAQIVLRKLDDDGHLGLRDAPDDLLDGLRRHTRGFPRALEAVKAILDIDETLTPRALLDRTRRLPENKIVQVLVGEAYDRLDAAAQQVMQALSVFPAPAAPVGVDVLLRAVNPTTNAEPILKRLLRRQLVRFQDEQYYLHAVDREYARDHIPAGSPGDSPSAFTLTGLQAGAADYYAEIRTPADSWRTLDDVRPQLAEFELRCDIGDYDTAAKVLEGIDYDYLQVWGHFRLLADLHRRISGRISIPGLNAVHLANLGLCLYRMGDYRQAIQQHSQVLAILQQLGHRRGEGATLSNLGNCHQALGDDRQAIDLHTQALGIAREIGDRLGEGATLNNLGNCHQDLGDYRQAIDLITKALAIADDIKDDAGRASRRANLGICHLGLGDYQPALDLLTRALAIARANSVRHTEGAVLSFLGLYWLDLGDGQQATDLLTEALGIARETGDRYEEAVALGHLGRAQLASDKADQTVALLEQSVSIADAIGNIDCAVEARSWLARALLRLGEPAAALTAAVERRDLTYPCAEPVLRMLEGLALLELRRPDESSRAFKDAVVAADALLSLAGKNITALEARALALSGLAVVTGDQAGARAAAEAFTRARAATSAPGVVADTRRLLDMITAHDQSGALARLLSG
jgi:tetratricopeptide (TPR) repeat protein